MKRFPTYDGDEPLIYHRLTGLRGDRRDVLRSIEQGFTLVPFDERGEGAELLGLDPIDIVAGDGGAVFCTAIAPYNPPGMLGAGHTSMRTAPGAAFRLSDLLKLAEVSVRPCDLQTYYMRAVTAGDFDVAWTLMHRQVDDVYSSISVLDPLSDVLRLIRESVETYDAEQAVRAIIEGAADVFDAFRDSAKVPASLRKELLRAAESATRFLEDFIDEEAVTEKWGESDTLDNVIEGAKGALVDDIEEAVLHANQEWGATGIDKKHEVLVWGSIPLSLAVLVFDNDGWVARRDGVSAENGFRGIIPTGKF